MTPADLLFLGGALCTLVTLVTAGVLAIRGRGSRALHILRLWATGAGIYLATGLVVSFVRPQVVKSIGEPWCFDDWCLTVERTQRTSTPAANIYRVDLRLDSRARRV